MGLCLVLYTTPTVKLPLRAVRVAQFLLAETVLAFIILVELLENVAQ